MKLVIAYSSKDEVENTRQTLPRIKLPDHGELIWCDGSATAEGRLVPKQFSHFANIVTGGADVAIAWKLSKALSNKPSQYTPYSHIMLIENDVLLDEDWFEPTMALFEKGRADGLEVGAVSPRSFVDRVLVQRDGYACMHNLGAGVVIFTREAAEIVLRSFRTHWWQNNVRLFAQLSGIDLRTYAFARGNEQWVTTDWGWDAQLAAHGLASLALTPAKCQMIGQKIPLEQQGLKLTTESGLGRRDEQEYDSDERVFWTYRDNLAKIRAGTHKPAWPGPIHRDGVGMLFFPHQIGFLEAQWQGNLGLRWNQGFGPFEYRAGEGGAFLSVLVSGSCSFLCHGGLTGAAVGIEDARSGFRTEPNLPASTGAPISISVPGGPIPRIIRMRLDEGAVFCGLQTVDQQMIDTSFRFSWDQLPEAK
jgi:hypothetical protein